MCATASQPAPANAGHDEDELGDDVCEQHNELGDDVCEQHSGERSFPYIAGWAASEGGTALIKQVLGHIQAITKQIVAAATPAEEAGEGAPEPPPPAVAAVKRRSTTVMAA